MQKLDLAPDDVEGFVPRMGVRWGPAALRARLAKDLVTPGLGTDSEHGKLCPYDVERVLLLRFDGERCRQRIPFEYTRYLIPVMDVSTIRPMSVSRYVVKETFAASTENAERVLRSSRPRRRSSSGDDPTVAQAAEEALVSRTTAYRYFPTQDHGRWSSRSASMSARSKSCFPTTRRRDSRTAAARVRRAVHRHVLGNERLYRTGTPLHGDVARRRSER